MKNTTESTNTAIKEKIRHSSISNFLSSFSNRFIATTWIGSAALFPIYASGQALLIYQHLKNQDPLSAYSYRIDSTIKQAKEDLATAQNGSTKKYIEDISHQFNPLTLASLYVSIEVKKIGDGNFLETTQNKAVVKWDLITISTGLWIVFLFSVRTLGKKTNPAISKIPTGENTEKKQQNPTLIEPKNLALQTLNSDLFRIKKTIDEASRRSSTMLFSGVVMAFVGLLVFYSATNETNRFTDSNNFRIEEYFSSLVRPTVMLIFIEAIAWFLFRQYTASIVEWRRLNQMTSKRADLFAAYISETESTSKETRLLLITSLLNNNTTVLREGETTEEIEVSKNSNKNPIFDFAHAILEKLSPLEKTKGQELKTNTDS